MVKIKKSHAYLFTTRRVLIKTGKFQENPYDFSYFQIPMKGVWYLHIIPDSMTTLAQRWNMVVSLADRWRWLYNIVSTLAQRWNTVVLLADRRRWLYNIVSTLA